MTDRDAYIEKTKDQLGQWNAEIEKMTAQADVAKADARVEYEKQIGEMRKNRDETQEHLNKLQASSDKAWGDIQKGFERAWDGLQKSFQSAVSRF